ALSLVNLPDEPGADDELRRRCSTVEIELTLKQSVLRDDSSAVAAIPASSGALVSQGKECLLVAAVRGKAAAAAELLRQGVDPNTPSVLSGGEASASGLPRLLITPLCGALA